MFVQLYCTKHYWISHKKNIQQTVKPKPKWMKLTTMKLQIVLCVHDLAVVVRFNLAHDRIWYLPCDENWRTHGIPSIEIGLVDNQTSKNQKDCKSKCAFMYVCICCLCGSVPMSVWLERDPRVLVALGLSNFGVTLVLSFFRFQTPKNLGTLPSLRSYTAHRAREKGALSQD